MRRKKLLCSYYRRKKLRKNEYWSPNPFEIRKKSASLVEIEGKIVENEEKKSKLSVLELNACLIGGAPASLPELTNAPKPFCGCTDLPLLQQIYQTTL